MGTVENDTALRPTKSAQVFRWLQSHRVVVCFALAAGLAVYYTLVSKPGVYYADTILRWLAIPETILGRTGQPVWLNVTPTLFMMLSYRITGNYAAFTLVQCFFFFFMAFLLINHLASRYWVLAMLLFINPVTIGYSVYGDMGVVCVAAIMGLLLFLVRMADMPVFKWQKAVGSALLCAFLAYIILGFRSNAFTVLLLFMGVAVWQFIQNKNWLKMTAAVAGIIAGAGLVVLVPKVLGVTSYNAASAGFMWEMLVAIDQMPEEKREEYLTYLDEIAGPGSTEADLPLSREDTVVHLLLSRFSTATIGTEENATIIFEKYRGLMKTEPGAFLKTKLYFIGRTMGIPTPVLNKDYEYATSQDIVFMGLSNTPRRRAFVQNVNAFLDGTVVFRLPWLWFVLGLLACVYQKGKRNNGKFVLPFLAACFYYGAFFINTQAFEFRYFFPAFVLLFAICVATFCRLLAAGVGWVKRRLSPRGDECAGNGRHRGH